MDDGAILALGVGAHFVRGQSDWARLALEESEKDVSFVSALGARSSDQSYRLPPELEGRARIVRVPPTPAADPNTKAMDVPAEWETPIHSMDMVVEVINDEGVARGVTATLEATQAITGVEVTDAYVDKGYRGHGYTGSTCVHIAGSRLKNATRTERRRRRRRSAIEPKIGHLKSDHRMNRCFLAGLRGDETNAVLAAAGANMRKLLRRLFYTLIRWLERAFVPSHARLNPLEHAA